LLASAVIYRSAHPNEASVAGFKRDAPANSVKRSAIGRIHPAQGKLPSLDLFDHLFATSGMCIVMFSCDRRVRRLQKLAKVMVIGEFAARQYPQVQNDVSRKNIVGYEFLNIVQRQLVSVARGRFQKDVSCLALKLDAGHVAIVKKWVLNLPIGP
jgi:hypothetical protein